jgi:hypothetical protein
VSFEGPIRRHGEELSDAIQALSVEAGWIASRSLSSGAPVGSQ